MADPEPESKDSPEIFASSSPDFSSASEIGLAEALGGGEATAKQQMAMIVQDQPDDSSYAEILRELAFYRMIQRGLADAEAGRFTGDAELRRRLRDW